MMKRDINKRKEKEAKYEEQKHKLAVLYDHGLIDENWDMIRESDM